MFEYRKYFDFRIVSSFFFVCHFSSFVLFYVILTVIVKENEAQNVFFLEW